MRSPEVSICQALAESSRIKAELAETAGALIAEMARTIVEAIWRGGKVLLLGNGGSAADAQHIAAELVGRYRLTRPAFPAIALTTNASILTAIGNDYGYDEVFARQVEALVSDGDVVVGMSTSGSSESVLKAMETARMRGAHCLGLTGKHGHALADMCDLCLMVPSDDTPRIQEAHIAVGHVLCQVIEAELAAMAEVTQAHPVSAS